MDVQPTHDKSPKRAQSDIADPTEDTTLRSQCAERMLSTAKAFIHDCLQPNCSTPRLVAYFSHTSPVRLSHTPRGHPYSHWGHFEGLNSIRSYFDLHPLYLPHQTAPGATARLTVDIDKASVTGTYSCERWWKGTEKRFHETGEFSLTFDLDNFKIVSLDVVYDGPSSLTAPESDHASPVAKVRRSEVMSFIAYRDQTHSNWLFKTTPDKALSRDEINVLFWS